MHFSFLRSQRARVLAFLILIAVSSLINGSWLGGLFNWNANWQSTGRWWHPCANYVGCGQ